MLDNIDEKIVRALCRALDEAAQEKNTDAETSREMISRGIDLLGAWDNPALKSLWVGFYLGFSRGCSFMASAVENPAEVKKRIEEE